MTQNSLQDFPFPSLAFRLQDARELGVGFAPPLAWLYVAEPNSTIKVVRGVHFIE